MGNDKTAVQIPPIPGSEFHDWFLGSGRDTYFMLTGEVRWLTILVELNGVTIDQFATGEKFFEDQEIIALWQKSVTVPGLFLGKPEITSTLNFVGAFVVEDVIKLLDGDSTGEFKDVPNDAVRESISAIVLGPPLQSGNGLGADMVLPETTSNEPGEDDVIIGIIDDGIAFANERFRNKNRTRIEHLWVQNVGTSFGQMFNAADINNLFGSSTFANVIDEDLVYKKAGVLTFGQPGHKSLGFRATHGAAVMDLAAGYSSETVTNNRPIIAVQLPTELVRDTSLTSLPAHLAWAVFYILYQSIFIAEERGKEHLPVVINFSFGNFAGPHDGTSLLERAIAKIIKIWRIMGWKVEIVLPAGNSYLSRTRAELAFSNVNQAIRIPWQVLPDDKTTSGVQIWMPHQGLGPVQNSRVRVRVIAPDGMASTNWVYEIHGAGEEYPVGAAQNNVQCLIRYIFWGNPVARGYFTIFLQPTARLNDGGAGTPAPIALSGTWTIEIQNLLLKKIEPVDMWILRDDTPFTYKPLGRQSFFDAACYRRYDHAGRANEKDEPPCEVKRAGTQNALATDDLPIVIGGVLRKELIPASYSAAGPVSTAALNPPNRKGPDALTVSDDSVAHRGVLASGTYSGSVIAMAGTSVAAPQIARILSQNGATFSATSGKQFVANLAAGHELYHPVPPSKPTAERGGAGRILEPPVYGIKRLDLE